LAEKPAAFENTRKARYIHWLAGIIPTRDRKVSTLGDSSTTDPGSSPRCRVEDLDPALASIQPGGGVCMRVELWWGYVRRAWLKWAFPSFVRRMREIRQGSHNPAPHEVLDPRDVKFYRNQPGGYYWAQADDPFAWRNRLPLVRVGLAEVILMSILLLGLAFVVAIWNPWCALPLLVIWSGVLWFFRNPRRDVPRDQQCVVSPADGKIVALEKLTHDPHCAGPAIKVGIFLSVFDVHINRVPLAARLIGTTYRPGKFLNALLPASARENEQLATRWEATESPYRRFTVRQIAGAIARRIVCWSQPGEMHAAGEAFGMIKLGSRTELILPEEAGFEITIKLGQRVRAGSTVLGRYSGSTAIGTTEAEVAAKECSLKGSAQTGASP
jgi:phosphatidylserine decarboxylase